MRAKFQGSRLVFVALAFAACISLISTDAASAQTATDTGYTVPSVGKISAGQAGVIFDNTSPLDWTGHLTPGGFGARVVPKVTDWFALPVCESSTQLYCIAQVTVAGAKLSPLAALPAVDNNPLARTAGNVKSGLVSRWGSSDGKILLAVNSYATFRCDLLCTLPDVSQVATDVRAYKVAKSNSYQALGFWDVYSALMGGHPEDQQLFRDCAWLDKGACGKISALPAAAITVSLQLPLALRTVLPGPDVLQGHLDNVYLTENTTATNPVAGGTKVRTITVSGTPATVGYFAGILKAPLPTWAAEGRTTILNPEDGNTLPITSNGAPSGANQVWQFALNEANSANDPGSCLAGVQGTAVAIGSDSSNVGAFDWVGTTDARFSTQDYPKNLNLTIRQVQNRVLMRNDFAGCMVSNKVNAPTKLSANADFKLGTSAHSIVLLQDVDSNNSTWLIKDLVYLPQANSAINVNLSLDPGVAMSTATSMPKAVFIAGQKYSILCKKKSGSSSYTAKATGLNPKCPAGYTQLGFTN